MTRIAVLDDYQSVALDYADWGPVKAKAEVTVFTDNLADPAAVVERLRPFDIVCAMRERTPLTRAILEQLPALKLIVTTGARNASIDMAAVKDRGITICHTGYNSSGAMEMTWALIMAAARQVPAEYASFQAGGWQRHVGLDLKGATLGIIGLGKIGQSIARIGKAFEMNVIAWSQNLTAETAEAASVTKVEKADLLRQSDFVTLHLVLSPRSRGIIGAAEIALMKPTAWLVNTSRGPLIDEAAMIAALEAKAIAGAALDVFDIEPLPKDHKLRTMDRVMASPHVGFVTQDTYRIFYGDTVENILAWMDGKPIRVLG
jgi:phosphoglycerate dehydrogenase-like enzyme